MIFAITAVLAAIVLAASAASASTDKPLPRWFHWGNTSDTHHGHPCIVVWAAKGKKAELCSDGSVQYPF